MTAAKTTEAAAEEEAAAKTAAEATVADEDKTAAEYNSYININYKHALITLPIQSNQKLHM